MDAIPAWAISIARWLGAFLALLLLVNFAVPRAWQELQGAVAFNAGLDDEDDLPSTEEADTEPAALDEGEVEAQSDVAARNGTVTGRTAATVTLGPGASDLLAIGFEAIPADTACLTEVTLEALLLDASADVQVLARPATLRDITALEDGQALPVDALIEGAPPAVAIAGEGTAGWLRWNVTDAYTLAARSARPEALVVLALTPREDEEADAEVSFATTDNDDDFSARLTWAAVADCSDVGTGTVEVPDPLIEQEATGVTEDPEDAEGAEG